MNRDSLDRVTQDPVFWPAVAVMVAFLLIPAGMLRPAPSAPERVGRAPSPNILADPRLADRLYSGTSVSEDGGKTWNPLPDHHGSRAVLLGGPHALPPAISSDGKLLVGEVLFDNGSVPLGLGPIAHAAEWNDGNWTIVQTELPDDRSLPAMRVTHVSYEPTTRRPVVTMENEIVGAIDVETPGKAVAAIVSPTGTPYVAVRETGKFPLYWKGISGWLPVADARNIVDLDQTSAGVVYAAGDQFGKKIGQKWTWTPWPPGFSVAHLLTHPEKPGVVAAWGNGRLILTWNGGSSFRDITPQGINVAYAAWPSFQRNRLLVLADNGDIYRLRL